MVSKDRTIKPETMSNRAHRLTVAVDRYCAETMADRKRALYVNAINLSIGVAHDIAAKREWLDKADTWLKAHVEAADFTEREDRWLAELVAYEAMEDALNDAKRRL